MVLLVAFPRSCSTFLQVSTCEEERFHAINNRNETNALAMNAGDKHVFSKWRSRGVTMEIVC